MDDDDFEYLSQFSWCVYKQGGGNFAAMRRPGGKGKAVLMHREIIGTPPHLETDHRDGNPLNNQKHNLRVATARENRWAFRKKEPGLTSAFRGVSVRRDTGKFTARIRANGRYLSLGCFDTPDAAARAYDRAARRYFGEFAAPNFPNPLDNR